MTASEPSERAISYLVDDPYPWYATMREERLVAYTQPEMPYARMFRVSRYADVQAILRDSRFGLEGVQQGRAKVIGSGALARSYGLWFLFMDPPNHTRLRALVSKAFTPTRRRGSARRGSRRRRHLLDRQEDKPTFNLIAEYAYQVRCW